MKLLTNLTKIDRDSAFCGCTSLVNIEGLDNITSFASNVFRGLSTLKSINITNKCDTLGWAMCNGDTKLESIGDISNVKGIPDYCFYACESLTSVNISNKCTKIGFGAFSCCNLLTSIGSLSNVTSIGEQSFYCTNIFKLVISDVCVNIGKYAFGACEKLTYIKCLAATPPTIGTYTFQGSVCSIYVPDNSVSAYQSATNWSDYTSRIKPMSEFTES